MLQHPFLVAPGSVIGVRIGGTSVPATTVPDLILADDPFSGGVELDRHPRARDL